MDSQDPSDAGLVELCENLTRWARITAAESVDRISPDETLFAQAASAIERLTRERDEARAALQPFARIKPSSFYSEDGSEEEGYCVFLANQNAAATAFTGADLARARSVISSPRYQEAEND